jgi:hypothetical protein
MAAVYLFPIPHGDPPYYFDAGDDLLPDGTFEALARASTPGEYVTIPIYDTAPRCCPEGDVVFRQRARWASKGSSRSAWDRATAPDVRRTGSSLRTRMRRRCGS